MLAGGGWATLSMAVRAICALHWQSLATDLASQRYNPERPTPTAQPWNFLGLNQSSKLYMMSRRLASAAAALFLALQFVLLGSGFSCITPSVGESGMADMAEMDMVGEPGLVVAAQATDSEQDPCHAPRMPADCHAMAPCAPAAIAATVVSELPVPSVGHETVQLIVLTPPSRSIPPDLPPPRA